MALQLSDYSDDNVQGGEVADPQNMNTYKKNRNSITQPVQNNFPVYKDPQDQYNPMGSQISNETMEHNNGNKMNVYA